MRSWLTLYCWWRRCAPFLTIPTSGERNWRGYGTQGIGFVRDLSPERLRRAAVTSVEVV
jgi:hypothetical protein